MLDGDKIYAFSITFGEETDSLDAEGKVIATSPVRPTIAAIEAVLPRFTGAIEQVPPAFSALKIDGRRAYDLARAGEDVTLATRSVTIHALSRDDAPDGGADAQVDTVTLTAHVSKGTKSEENTSELQSLKRNSYDV